MGCGAELLIPQQVVVWGLYMEGGHLIRQPSARERVYPLEMGAVAEDGERDPVTERGLRGLGLVGRVRGDWFRISAA